MSLGIDVDEVREVLLPDGWHHVRDSSFNLDSYDYLWNDGVLHGGGGSGVCATGFQFVNDEGNTLSGPLTSVLAVRHDV